MARRSLFSRTRRADNGFGGYEVRNPEWRKQFVGKTAADPLRLNADIRNISGATLSSRHVTDGVKRVLATYAVALR